MNSTCIPFNKGEDLRNKWRNEIFRNLTTILFFNKNFESLKFQKASMKIKQVNSITKQGGFDGKNSTLLGKVWKEKSISIKNFSLPNRSV